MKRRTSNLADWLRWQTMGRTLQWSTRYSGYYATIPIKEDCVNPIAFRKNFEKTLKDKIVEFPSNAAMHAVTKDDENIQIPTRDAVTTVRLGGIKPAEVATMIVDRIPTEEGYRVTQREGKCKGWNMTVWFPGVAFS